MTRYLFGYFLMGLGLVLLGFCLVAVLAVAFSFKEFEAKPDFVLSLMTGMFVVLPMVFIGGLTGVYLGIRMVLQRGWAEEPASEQQKQLADSLGIQYPKDVTKGQLSQLFDKKKQARSKKSPS